MRRRAAHGLLSVARFRSYLVLAIQTSMKQNFDFAVTIVLFFFLFNGHLPSEASELERSGTEYLADYQR